MKIQIESFNGFEVGFDKMFEAAKCLPKPVTIKIIVHTNQSDTTPAQARYEWRQSLIKDIGACLDPEGEEYSQHIKWDNVLDEYFVKETFSAERTFE